MNIAVIGGGAAGMSAAFFAAENHATVTILEHKERVGIKLKSTGNGKCNYSNTSINEKDYNTDDVERLQEVLQSFSPSDAIDYFARFGMLSKEKNGGLYPITDQATTVLEVLMYRLKELGVSIRTEVDVKKIAKTAKGFELIINGKKETFDRIILCCGGKSAPKTGSDGSGYEYARQIGLSITQTYPSLVQLRVKEDYFKQLAGIRCDAIVSLFVDNECINRQQGELQIVDYGLSGIPIFQLSGLAAEAVADKKRTQIHIDLLPKTTIRELQAVIREKRKFMKQYTAEEFMVGTIHKKWIPLILKKHGISPMQKAEIVTEQQWIEIYEELKDYIVTITATNGFDNAQVTRGGVSLREVNEHMMAKSVEGCYIAGELLNVDGKCGGYNLHWAWASGRLAGIHCATDVYSQN